MARPLYMWVSEQGVGHARLGCRTQQNARGLDLGTDSVGELWAYLMQRAVDSDEASQDEPQNSPDKSSLNINRSQCWEARLQCLQAHAKARTEGRP